MKFTFDEYIGMDNTQYFYITNDYTCYGKLRISNGIAYIYVWNYDKTNLEEIGYYKFDDRSSRLYDKNDKSNVFVFAENLINNHLKSIDDMNEILDYYLPRIVENVKHDIFTTKTSYNSTLDTKFMINPMGSNVQLFIVEHDDNNQLRRVRENFENIVKRAVISALNENHVKNK